MLILLSVFFIMYSFYLFLTVTFSVLIFGLVALQGFSVKITHCMGIKFFNHGNISAGLRVCESLLRQN